MGDTYRNQRFVVSSISIQQYDRPINIRTIVIVGWELGRRCLERGSGMYVNTGHLAVTGAVVVLLLRWLWW